ncbi:MAG: OmpH family outer membrane protein [Phycisphaerales bacterium]|nr:OmpH family outer membrane protein [Phycisphaerales bacterium]
MKTWMMSGAVAAAICTAWFSGMSASNATQPAPTGRVAAVDVVMIFNEYQRQKDLSEELRVKQEETQQEAERRQHEADGLEAIVSRMSPNDPLYVQRYEELLKMQIENKNWLDVTQSTLTRELAVWSTKIYQEILIATEQVADQYGLDLVMYREEFRPTNFDPQLVREQIRARKVVYARDSINVSSQVLERLNETYRSQPREQMIKVNVKQ